MFIVYEELWCCDTYRMLNLNNKNAIEFYCLNCKRIITVKIKTLVQERGNRRETPTRITNGT